MSHQGRLCAFLLPLITFCVGGRRYESLRLWLNCPILIEFSRLIISGLSYRPSAVFTFATILPEAYAACMEEQTKEIVTSNLWEATMILCGHNCH